MKRRDDLICLGITEGIYREIWVEMWVELFGDRDDLG